MHPKTISPVFLDVLRGIPILYILNLLLNFGKERLNNTKLTKRQRQTKAEELGPPWLHGLAEMVFQISNQILTTHDCMHPQCDILLD